MKALGCVYCGARYKYEAAFIEHQNTRHLKKSYHCTVCNNSFCHKSHFDKECGICKKVFTRKADLKRHQQLHRKNPRFPICKKKISSMTNLKLHLRIHSDEKPFSCPQCNRSFRRSHHLKQHLTTHKKKRYYCDHCQKTFASNQYLSRHKRTSCRGLLKPSCNQKSSHVSIHSRDCEKSYQCVMCKKSFKLKRNLLRHKLLKNGIAGPTPYLTVVNSKDNSDYKIGNQQWILAENQSTQKSKKKQQKSHKCNKCGKSFMNKAILIKHVRLHEGIKPFNCDQCCKPFALEKYLKEHKRVHVKPHQCDQCGQSFTRRDRLQHHSLYKCKKKTFQCNLCKKSFASKYSIQNHMLEHVTYH